LGRVGVGVNSYFFTLPQSAPEIWVSTAGSARVVWVIPCNGTDTITIIYT